MAGEGIVLNAAVSMLAGGSFFVAACCALMSRRGSASALFAALGIVTTLAGLRQLVVLASSRIPELVSLDLALYLVGVIPGALSMVPLSYLTMRILSGSKRAARGVAFGFLVAGAIGVALIYSGGVTGPFLSDWGGEWEPLSMGARVMVLLFMLLPALLTGAVMVRVGRREGGDAGRRLRLVGWSIAICYGAFTIDAVGATGVGLLGVRISMLAAGILAFHAYQPADGLFRFAPIQTPTPSVVNRKAHEHRR